MNLTSAKKKCFTYLKYWKVKQSERGNCSLSYKLITNIFLLILFQELSMLTLLKWIKSIHIIYFFEILLKYFIMFNSTWIWIQRILETSVKSNAFLSTWFTSHGPEPFLSRPRKGETNRRQKECLCQSTSMQLRSTIFLKGSIRSDSATFFHDPGANLMNIQMLGLMLKA